MESIMSVKSTLISMAQKCSDYKTAKVHAYICARKRQGTKCNDYKTAKERPERPERPVA